jgi:pyrroline-5-carboxylate reductase
MDQQVEKILVLGAGKMIEGIFTGLQKKMGLEKVFFFSPSGTSAKKLALKLGAQAIEDLDKIAPDMIFIGCKPQQIRELKSLIGERFKDVPAVSILAALTERTQSEVLGIKKMIRVMPNLAVAYNEGVSLLSSVSAPGSLERVKELFQLLGHVEIVSESELEDLTLLTGSSQAFFFEFAKYLANSFQSLDEKTREILIRKSLIGAAHTLQNSESNLEELIKNVTSKGGVTISVLEELRRQKLDASVKKGIESGHQRAKDLSASILQN